MALPVNSAIVCFWFIPCLSVKTNPNEFWKKSSCYLPRAFGASPASAQTSGCFWAQLNQLAALQTFLFSLACTHLSAPAQQIWECPEQFVLMRTKKENFILRFNGRDLRVACFLLIDPLRVFHLANVFEGLLCVSLKVCLP